MPTPSDARELMRRKRLVTYGWWTVIVLGFSALVLPTIGQGVGSWDSHRVIISVRTLLDRHEIVQSRPPGHPTSEFYLFGTIGWLLERFSERTFDAAVFLTLQWIAALAVAGVFIVWLKRTGISPLRSALALVCLLFSPQFLDQAVNGEEFIFGLLFLLGAVAVLAREPCDKPNYSRLTLAIALFALAMGCRSEFVLVGFIIFPAHFLSRSIRDWKVWLATVAGTFVACIIVWLPVIPLLLAHGLRANEIADVSGPLLLVWGYKVLFSCFGFPASVVLLTSLVLSLIRLRTPPGKWTPREWGELVAVAIGLLYLALFRYQPGKPPYLLVCLPFLLWLIARRHIAWLFVLTGLTLTGVFVGVDIFHERQLVAPHFTPGAYLRAVAGKPFYQLAYIQALARTPLGPKTAFIGDAWSWVYDYHIDRGTFPAERLKLVSHDTVGFAIGGNPNHLILPRELTLGRGILKHLHQEHYEIVMDRVLWQTLFARYEVALETSDHAMVGSTPVRLVTVNWQDLE